jgi:hypothetical protein
MAARENPSLAVKLDPMRENLARADDEGLPGRQPRFHSLHYEREKVTKCGIYQILKMLLARLDVLRCLPGEDYYLAVLGTVSYRLRPSCR